MNKMTIIIVTIVVLIIILFGVVLFLTSGATKSADNFFALIKNGDTEGAYNSVSLPFKVNTTAEEFKNFLDTSSIADFDRVFWSFRKVSSGVATLEGNIKTKSGNEVPVVVILTKEDDLWKILSINVKGGITQVNTIPSDSDLEKLVNDSIKIFGKAVKEDDFSTLYASASKLWQSQITSNDLRSAFKPFVDQQLDINALDNTSPVFSERPKIDENGVLALVGYYSYTDHPPLKFEVEYVYEHPSWKLFGIKAGYASSAGN